MENETNQLRFWNITLMGWTYFSLEQMFQINKPDKLCVSKPVYYLFIYLVIY